MVNSSGFAQTQTNNTAGCAGGDLLGLDARKTLLK